MISVTDEGSPACKNDQALERCHPPSRGPIKNWERQMSYLTGVANQRPLLRITGQILLAFCCAAPLVLAFSSFVAYGVHTLIH